MSLIESKPLFGAHSQTSANRISNSHSVSTRLRYDGLACSLLSQLLLLHAHIYKDLERGGKEV